MDAPGTTGRGATALVPVEMPFARPPWGSQPPAMTDPPARPCGSTRAVLPPGVPTGGLPACDDGAVHGGYHLSKRTTQALLDDLFGVEVGLGTIVNLEQATTQAVAEPVAEARAYVQSQPAAYADETGWREGSQRAWLWTAVTEWVTVFVGRRSRSGRSPRSSWARAAGGGW